MTKAGVSELSHTLAALAWSDYSGIGCHKLRQRSKQLGLMGSRPAVIAHHQAGDVDRFEVGQG